MLKKSLLAIMAIAIAMPAFAEFPILKSIPKEFQGCWVDYRYNESAGEKMEHYFIVSNKKIEADCLECRVTYEMSTIRSKSKNHIIFGANATWLDISGEDYKEYKLGELILKNGKLIFKDKYSNIPHSRCSAKQRKEAGM